MKQYKLLKGQPGIEAGTIGIQQKCGNYYFKRTGPFNDLYPGVFYSKPFMDAHPDFFEEVVELEKVFTMQDLYMSFNNQIRYTFVDFVKANFPQHIDQLKYLK